MGGPYVWDVNTPPGGETRRQGANRLKALKSTTLQAYNEGPMPNFPTDGNCGLGWPRIFQYATLTELTANAVGAPYGRLGYVSADSDPTKIGMYIEKSTGWTLING